MTARIAVIVLAVTAIGRVGADEADVKALLEGVAQIGAPGVPGTICVFGPTAEAVVCGRAGGALEAVVAVARYEKGRCVAFGHDGYFGPETLAVADTGKLMENAARWAAGKAGGPAPRVAVHQEPGLLAYLRNRGFVAEALERADWADKLTGYDVLCLRAPTIDDDAEAAKVAQWVRGGGGIIAADTGWGWLQLHPGKTLKADHAGNKVFGPAGLLWSDGMAHRTCEKGFAAETAPPALVHAGRALEAVVAHGHGGKQLAKADLAQAVWVVTSAARNLPPDDKVLEPKLRGLENEAAVPTPEQPLNMDRPLQRLALTLQMRDMDSLSPEQMKAHPAAARFPGAVPADAPRVTKTLQVDTKVPAWHSTGLYAAPGEAVRVTVPEAAVGKGLGVRIGAHTDTLWHLDSWARAPEITREFALAKATTAAANAFGGPVYIVVPGGCKLGVVAVEIAGAVEAPHFILGRTDPAQWRSEVRDRPAPWAEMEAAEVILTVPSSVVRKIDNPVPIMEFWAHVMDCCAELATIPAQRERPERYCTDQQISAGYMHSGYPIMTFLDVAPIILDPAKIAASGGGGGWGLFHEMGHNHQSGDWTFDGTGEVTENLFSLYVIDRIFGHSAPGHPAVAPAERERNTEAYFAAGASFEKWKSNPFLALYMYMQLQEAFGWEAYRKVFAEYRALPDSQRPKNDDEKRDQWMVRFSRTIGRNLGPFFVAWGVPTSQAARDSIKDLPQWMPEGMAAAVVPTR
jgi:hypothetical protein